MFLGAARFVVEGIYHKSKCSERYQWNQVYGPLNGCSDNWRCFPLCKTLDDYQQDYSRAWIPGPSSNRLKKC